MNNNRRDFLQSLGAISAGLLIPVMPAEADSNATSDGALNDWVWISPDGQITLGLSQCEAGQGVYTGLPQVLAEELDADWRQVSVRFVTGRDAYRSSAAYEPLQQFVGASMSVSMFYDRLRLAGAQARDLLARAAAEKMQVRASQCITRDSEVIHIASGRKLRYAEVVEAAAKLPVNPRPRLKTPGQFKLIGRNLPRLDTPMKVNGQAQYGIDVQLPGMLYAAVRFAPSLTGTITAVHNQAQIEARSGVVAILLTSQWPSPRLNTVIVVADSYWTAQQAAHALELQTDPGAGAALSSAGVTKACERALAAPESVVVRDIGAADAQLQAPGLRRVEATYHTPYITHATMEPMCATAHFRGDEVEVWGPIQGQDMVREWVHKLHQVPESKVTVNTTFLGGSFGRKYVPDFVLHAVAASKAVGRPVKVIRSREEDTRHSYYRPNASAHYQAVLDGQGLPVALKARVVGHSLYASIKPPKFKAAGGWDETMVEALYDLVYRVPHLKVEATNVPQPVPVSFLRSVGSTSSVFFLESFVSEMARAAGQDDFEYRRRLLQGNAQALAVLERAAKDFGWRKPGPKGCFRGLAFNVYTGRGEEFQTTAALALELDLRSGSPRLTRALCAVDCGRAINPGLIRANIEGGIGFGLTGALKSAITFEQGAVVQSNFHDYPLLKLAEMPAIQVAILDSERSPQGCGEVSVSLVAPALASALHQATGQRPRSLPFELKA